MEDQEIQVKRESTYPLFSKFFTIRPQNVVDYLGSMKKQMEDFIEAFKKRIQAEINYSKSLTQVSKSLDKYIKPGTELASSFISSAFKVQHEQRSRQALELAESLKTEIETMCLEMLKKETNFCKKMEKDVKRYYKEASSVDENHREALTRFEGISREMEEMIITKNIMKYTTGIPQEKKVKLISKAMDSIRQNKEYEKLYLQSVKGFNNFTNAYNQEIKSQLDQAETQVRDQMTMQCDCMRKLIVAEVSMFKNIEYDLLNISKQMEYLDTQKEIEIFVEEGKNSNSNRIVSEDKPEQDTKRSSQSESSNEYQIQLKKMLGKSMLSNSLLHVDEEYFSWMLFNKKNKQLRDIISGIWKMHREAREPLKTENEDKSIQKPEQQLQEGQEVIYGSKKEQEIGKEEEEEEKEKGEVGEEIGEEREEGEKGEEQKKEKRDPEEVMGEQAESEKGDEPEPIETSPKKQIQNNRELQNQEVKFLKTEEPHDWPQELKMLLQSFKIQHPPNLMTTFQKQEKNSPSLPIMFNTFMDIMKTISALWNVNDLEPQFVAANLKVLEGYMSEQHLYRLIALIFLQEYRIQLEVMIKNGSCASTCAKVLRVIIRESQKQNDTFIIRGILGLIFTYYWVDDKYKKLLYLSSQVYQSEIWKRNDFWEAAIFETTYEQMAMFSKQKGETLAETMLREKNIIFSQLASFCHYMVMLGITSKNVRLIVGRYCRLYEMTEEQNKDLSKMITNTAKQFKETSFQFSLKVPEKEKSVINE